MSNLFDLQPKPKVTGVDLKEISNPHGNSISTRMGNPTPLGMGGFAVTLLTLSLAMMGFRGVSVQNLFVGNFCFVGCFALLISAQWEILKGNTFSYTVFSAFGLFYGGYGFILLPTTNVAEAYSGKTSEYYNALGFFILIWAVLNILFMIASFKTNLVYLGTFAAIEICFCLDATANFIRADGNLELSLTIMKIGGVFGFIAGLLGFYIVAHDLIQDVLPFEIPMGQFSKVRK